MNSASQKVEPQLLASERHQPLWLSTFVDNYQKLSTTNLHLLDDIYHVDVVFEDPMHTLKGLSELHHYFQQLYTNLQTCTFVINDVFLQDEQAAIYWRMTFEHPKLNGGQPVVVDGHSHVKGHNDKVIFHRDYVDLGAMLYEHVPLLGRIVKWLKTRAAK